VSERILTETGVKTCGDVYTHRAMISAMDKQLGLRGLLKAYLGLSSNVVHPPARELRKSVGVETYWDLTSVVFFHTNIGSFRTFSTLSDKDKLLGKLEKVASDLEEDLARTGWAGRTITLKYKLDNFQSMCNPTLEYLENMLIVTFVYEAFTRAKTLPRYITTKEDILAAGKDLFLRELPLKLRLIGLRVTTLKDLRPHAGRIEQVKLTFDTPHCLREVHILTKSMH
jgi:DNA polymerase kappa